MELKRRMTFEEMAEHLTENTSKVPSRVSVGKYAKTLGYRVYKPVIAGVVHFFYVNEEMPV